MSTTEKQDSGVTLPIPASQDAVELVNQIHDQAFFSKLAELGFACRAEPGGTGAPGPADNNSDLSCGIDKLSEILLEYVNDVAPAPIEGDLKQQIKLEAERLARDPAIRRAVLAVLGNLTPEADRTDT